MDGLRWVLIIVGLGLIVGVYFWGRPNQKREEQRKQRKQDRVQPVFGDTDAPDSEEDLSSESASDELQLNLKDDPEQIVSLCVVARSGEKISGHALCQAVDKVGLVYGEMNIFHRYQDSGDHKSPIFSLANLLAPGAFDMKQMANFDTPGVSLFMALPGPVSALDGWDSMLATGERVAELLDADLLDETRSALGRQRIAHIRDQLRAFDRKRETAAKYPLD